MFILHLNEFIFTYAADHKRMWTKQTVSLLAITYVFLVTTYSATSVTSRRDYQNKLRLRLLRHINTSISVKSRPRTALYSLAKFCVSRQPERRVRCISLSNFIRINNIKEPYKRTKFHTSPPVKGVNI